MGRARAVPPAEANRERWEAAPLLTLETPVDLEGNAGPQRLVVGTHKLVVSNGLGSGARERCLEEVEAFRVEPSLARHFFSAYEGAVDRPSPPPRRRRSSTE